MNSNAVTVHYAMGVGGRGKEREQKQVQGRLFKAMLIAKTNIKFSFITVLVFTVYILTPLSRLLSKTLYSIHVDTKRICCYEKSVCHLMQILDYEICLWY